MVRRIHIANVTAFASRHTEKGHRYCDLVRDYRNGPLFCEYSKSVCANLIMPHSTFSSITTHALFWMSIFQEFNLFRRVMFKNGECYFVASLAQIFDPFAFTNWLFPDYSHTRWHTFIIIESIESFSKMLIHRRIGLSKKFQTLGFHSVCTNMWRLRISFKALSILSFARFFQAHFE